MKELSYQNEAVQLYIEENLFWCTEALMSEALDLELFRASFTQSYGLTNQEIVEKIVHFLQENGKIHFYFYRNWYYFGGEIAKSDGKESIGFNKKFLNRTKHDVRNTIIHEICHLAGFHHDKKLKNWNKTSVPYLIGNIFEKLSRDGEKHE